MKTYPCVRDLLRVVIGLGVASGASAWATTTAPSSGGSTPTPSAYIENPQPTVTTVTSVGGPYYSGSSWGGSYYGGYWGGYYSGFHDTVVNTYLPRRYFFPPAPPALGNPYTPNRTKAASRVRSTIPLALSDYVNEPFYSPLSPFLFEESLSRSRQRRLDDYKAAKTALVEELRAKLAALQSVDAAARESQLAEFAREQTPRIIPVEKMAYDLRDDLTRWRLFSDTSDWNEGRTWRMGDDVRWESTLDESKLMRGAAYFQDGLSPAQRRLLREYSMELDDSASAPGSDIALDNRGPYFYFSPETSRIRLPAGMPPELQEKIATYTREKMQLKKELRDVLYREDRRWLNSRRSAALRELAEKQAPRIAALEPLAEEIRRGLAPLPNPARPRSLTQTLPGALADRIARFMDAKAQFEQVMNARMATVKRDLPKARVEFVKMDEGFGIQLVGSRRLNEQEKARLDSEAEALTQFNAQQIRVYVALVNEKNAIREDLLKSTGNLAPMVTPRLIDLILRDYTATLAMQELWRRYHDYEVAVLQPGLSPEQRRLLFDAALITLDQQLPYYTY